MDGLNPVLGGVDIVPLRTHRIGRDGAVCGHGCRSSGAGYDEVDILREIEEAKVADFTRLASDGDDVGEPEQYHYDAEQETPHQNILQEAWLGRIRLHVCKFTTSIQKNKKKSQK